MVAFPPQDKKVSVKLFAAGPILVSLLEKIMSENTIKSVLQIMAVAAIFIGAVMTSNAIVSIVGFNNVVDEMHLNSTGISTSGFGVIGVLIAIMPAIWGALLFSFSPKIANRIHG